MPTCLYAGCQEKSSKDSNIMFHRIPDGKKDRNKREVAQKWLHHIGTLNPQTKKPWNVDNFDLRNSKKVCSKHFSEDSYEDFSMYAGMRDWQGYLT